MAQYKDKLVEQYLQEPLKLQDPVKVSWLDTKTEIQGKGKSKKEVEIEYNRVELGEVINLDPLTVNFNKGSQTQHIKVLGSLKNWTLEKVTKQIGAKPFQKSIYDICRPYASLLWQMEDWSKGFGRDGKPLHDFYKDDNGNKIEEFDFDPYVEINGELKRYQRPLVWTLEQKQMLIESIYQGLDCGKVIFRRRGFRDIVKRNTNGIKTAFIDIMDGKQRCTTLISFMKDEFPDLNGFYFSDFTSSTKMKFREGGYIQWFEITERATDQEILKVFLATNHLGVPQSVEHIEFVKRLLKKD